MLELSLACQNTDRTRALLENRVTIDGVKIHFVTGPAEELFQRAFRHAEFDISELSLGTHLLTTARAASHYIGVPVFLSRAFRHSAVYIRGDRGIDSADALKGRRIGVPDFQQTAGIWVRGMLADEYGIGNRDVRWVIGGLEQTGRAARVPYTLPSDIQVEPIAPDQTLSRLLDAGEIDAVIAPKPPSCFGRNEHVRRLFPVPREVEQTWFRKTGIFPPMHTLGIRRSLVEKHPWLPVNVYAAFKKARDLALTELQMTDTLRVMHPWITEELDQVRALMGHDFWRYGVKECRDELDTLQRYALSDGLIERPVPIDDLFAPSTSEAFNF
ncbi:ABC transporter substrate-binding protein [Trinickia dinghuensis]|uniref:ABC transporter substrate-binding protein n=1 Tax=Trinickia dinghuensis TaxID=2291023 RepID=A0A3D8JYE7_9BURK|nr:ABC transporter substrate-binding protein [Trinickia dinghuensis]RDU98183.1 ABC transporter substrate-binding protein [Trinickia dinghuensis]